MAMNLRQNQAPLYIKVNEKDNTAIIVNDGGLPKGTVFSCGLVLEEDVPQGHKVALTDLNQGDEIVRYGEVIGFADETIKRGELDKGVPRKNARSSGFRRSSSRKQSAQTAAAS